VELRREPLPAGAADRLEAAFPGPPAPGEPRAFLSFASWGDMKFGEAPCAPNREAFLRSCGLEPGGAFGLELAHSRRIVAPGRGDDAAAMARELGGADGIVLDDPGLAATVTVADCMPIWLLDRGSGCFGLLHSGWKGTGILRTAVDFLADRRGTSPRDLAVILGPAIGSCCYGVPEARSAAFAAEFGPTAAEGRGGGWFLDLRAANLALAEELGVGYALSIEACTSCDRRLGSYRRQGQGAFTRMLAVCGSPAAG